MSLENFADRFQNHILISLDENKNVIWAAEQVVMTERGIGSTMVAIIEPPDILSLGRQENRLLV